MEWSARHIETVGAGQWASVGIEACKALGLPVCEDQEKRVVYNMGYYSRVWKHSPVQMEGGVIFLTDATDAQKAAVAAERLTPKERIAAQQAEIETLRAQLANATKKA